MKPLSKICKIHGPLETKDIVQYKNDWPRCNICKKEHQYKMRYLPFFDEEGIHKTRKCCRCKIEKSINEFQNHDKRLRSPYCSICRKENSTKVYHKRKSWIKKYGITVEQYDEMLMSQNHACDICKQHETAIMAKSRQVKPLSIDHCHTTNKVRGLLCHNCNVSIGYAKESIPRLYKIIEYLKKHQS